MRPTGFLLDEVHVKNVALHHPIIFDTKYLITNLEATVKLFTLKTSAKLINKIFASLKNYKLRQFL